MSDRIRLAIAGAGDVVHRHHLPALRDLADRVELVGFVDRRDFRGDTGQS